MSGDTEKNISGWTTDTLKAYLEKRIDANNDIAYANHEAVKELVEQRLDDNDKAYEQRHQADLRSLEQVFRSHDTAVQLAMDVRKTAIDVAVEDLNRRLVDADEHLKSLAIERQEQTTRAFAANSVLLQHMQITLENTITQNDVRYQQRFEAQEANLVTAINAQEKAVQAALDSAERAVSKAELATEKRFEGVNEFRAQLADQANRLMPRIETEQAIIQLRSYVETVVAQSRQLSSLEFQSQKDAVAAALGAAKEAVSKAEMSTEARFASVNEFRAQLADQSATFLPRGEFSVQYTALTDRLAAIERIQAIGGGEKRGGAESEAAQREKAGATKQTITLAIYGALFLLSLIGFIAAYASKP